MENDDAFIPSPSPHLPPSNSGSNVSTTMARLGVLLPLGGFPKKDSPPGGAGDDDDRIDELLSTSPLEHDEEIVGNPKTSSDSRPTIDGGIPIKPEKGSTGSSTVISIKSSPDRRGNLPVVLGRVSSAGKSECLRLLCFTSDPINGGRFGLNVNHEFWRPVVVEALAPNNGGGLVETHKLSMSRLAVTRVSSLLV